jgi:secreted Zn-dependent insulinase-like peptidase
MSLLGPDDFDLTKKERKKKLAKDLSPEVYKQIEKWLDREDDPEALHRLSELVGPERARQLLAKKKKSKDTKDPLRDF